MPIFQMKKLKTNAKYNKKIKSQAWARQRFAANWTHRRACMCAEVFKHAQSILLNPYSVQL